MLYPTVDMIVRRSLLERKLPLHYYIEFLCHATACLRELTMDSLRIINTVELPVNSYFAIDLPDDFVDDVGISIPVGALLQPIPKNDSITPLRIQNSNGDFTTYGDQSNTTGQSFFGFIGNWTWFWNINDYGESTGRRFGTNGGAKQNGYKLIKERRQIQLTETFTSDTAVLTYISDGQSSDNASMVDTYAFRCIQTFIDWQRSTNAAIKDSGEARTFYNERRLLRARLSELTVTDIRQIVLQAYHASIKN